MQTDGGFSEIVELPPVHSEVLEDEEPIRAWLKVRPLTVAVSIASGGDNVFNLALDRPEKVYGVDISPAQISLCRLKSAAFAAFSEGEIASLMGTYSASAADREPLLDRVLRLTDLGFGTEDDRLFAQEYGLLRIGAFERMVAVVREQIHEAVGEDTVRRLITEPAGQRRRSLWERHHVCDKLAPVFQVFFDEDALEGIFTPKQARPIFACSPFPLHLLRVVEALVVGKNPCQNYYLHRWALGGYLPGGPVPPYLDPANLGALRAVLSRIEWVTSGLLEFLRQLPATDVSHFNLSNVLDWCDDEYACQAWEEITRVATPGARVFTRSFLYERPHHQNAERLGWLRHRQAEESCHARERVGYYPHYELWSRAD